MRLFVCSVCGFAYDEAAGLPAAGFLPGTLWDDLPRDWICPICRAPKSAFAERKAVELPTHEIQRNDAPVLAGDYTPGLFNVIFSNLAKGCEKQYRTEEARLFRELADYYAKRTPIPAAGEAGFAELLQYVQADLTYSYGAINSLAGELKDRGTLRALTWGEKVSRMLEAHLHRYQEEQDAFLAETQIYVCEICGFVYIGDDAPDICPVCKVPRLKFSPVTRRS